MAVPVLTIIRHVLTTHLAVVAPREDIRPEDAVTVLDALNTVLDDWSADVQSSVAGVLTPFTTTPALAPHTIGPTGTWVLPTRPVKIDGLAVAFSAGIYTAVTIHDDPAWWLAQPTSGASGSLTDAYYAPDVPNGSLYFASTPTAALDVLLLTRWTLGAVVSTASLVLPPGYQSALELTVAEAVADAFHATFTEKQVTRAGKARARIFGNNLRVPSLSAAGLGLPGTGRGGTFDYRTRTWH
jgi:hypothetical protein